jgi:hypothetical protein
MKKLILYISFCLCSILACKAQSVEVKQKGNFVTYKTEIFRSQLFNILQTHNAQNKLFNEKQILFNGLDLGSTFRPIYRFEKKERNQMMINLLEVLPKKRIEELLKEESILTKIYLNGEGEILEIDFSLNRPTSITAKELELMEKNIKRKGKIEIMHDDFKGGYNFFPISARFFFKDYLALLNK